MVGSSTLPPWARPSKNLWAASRQHRRRVAVAEVPAPAQARQARGQRPGRGGAQQLASKMQSGCATSALNPRIHSPRIRTTTQCLSKSEARSQRHIAARHASRCCGRQCLFLMVCVVLRLVPQGGVLALQRGPRQAWIHPEAAMEAIHLQEALPTAEETAALVQTPRGTRMIPLARVDPEHRMAPTKRSTWIP